VNADQHVAQILVDQRPGFRRPATSRVVPADHRRHLALHDSSHAGHDRTDLVGRHQMALLDLAALHIHLDPIDLDEVTRRQPASAVFRDRNTRQTGDTSLRFVAAIRHLAVALDEVVNDHTGVEGPADPLRPALVDREVNVFVDQSLEVAPGHLDQQRHLIGIQNFVFARHLTGRRKHL
jgi:hypothetical protein